MQMDNLSPEITSLLNQLETTESALKTVKAHESLLKQALRIAGLGIWEYDIFQKKVTWSEEVYRIYELDPGSPAPKMEDIIHYASNEEKQYI